MKPLKMFDRSNLKVDPELQDEIIRRFNDYDTLIRVMNTVASNLKVCVNTSSTMQHTDKVDLYKFANLLQDATKKEWLKENVLYY